MELVGSPANMSTGWNSRIVRVQAVCGPQVLKMYPEHWGEPAVVYEHSILRRLDACGFPAVRLSRTPSGETMVYHDGHWFAMFEFERGFVRTGCYLSPTTRHRLQGTAGRTLAGIHDSLADFEPEGQHHLGFESLAGARHHDLRWMLTQLGDLPRRPTNNVRDEAHAAARWLAERTTDVAERLTAHHGRLSSADLPRVVIHGDFGTHNMLFLRSNSARVVDFELARIDWRAIDVLAAMARLEARSERTAFLTGYRGEIEFTRNELAHLAEMWDDHRLRGAIRYWFDFHRFGGEWRLVAARHRIEEADRAHEGGVIPWV